MVLRKSFYIRWSAGRSPRVHEVNPGRDPSHCTREDSFVWEKEFEICHESNLLASQLENIRIHFKKCYNLMEHGFLEWKMDPWIILPKYSN